MGMFDSVDCSKSGLELKCAYGHDTSKESFQSKDLDCSMENYSIIDKQLYQSKWDYDKKQFQDFEPYSYTGQMYFYSHCSQCPITKWKLKDKPIPPWGPQEHEIWIEYLALFNDGKVIVFKEIKLETVEDSRKQMLDSNWEEIT